MVTRNDIIDIIAQNQNCADFCIGDILINLPSLTIDYIKATPEIGNEEICFIKICCEESERIEEDILQVAELIKDMIIKKEIILGEKTGRTKFGNTAQQMRLRSEPIHCQRHFPGLNIIGRERLATKCFLPTQD